MPPLRLSEVYIYPIKSARGISLASARVDVCGLEHDRRWMVVDAQGHFLTQRSIPRMALIRVELDATHLIIQSIGMDTLHLPLRPVSADPLRVTVWEDSFDAVDAGEEAASWFSNMLSRPCRLAFMPDQAERFVNPQFSPDKRSVSFADAFPFMLISRASLDDLNARLAEPVPMDRFRPNLVVEGCSAFEEDTWATLRIGNVDFRVAKPCSRCTVPTVNQETAIRSLEPIHTLRTYRTMNGKIYFGQNLIHGGQGVLNVGDEVRVSPL